jgi:hypothetical protein
MSYRAYEADKADWIRRNPTATPRQYEAAMRALARKHRI